MKRRWETTCLIFLPLLVLGLLIWNAGIMSRIYVPENGPGHESKIYRAKILPDKYDVTIKRDEPINLNFKLVNQGSFMWMHTGTQAVNLSYHVLDREKQGLIYDNERYELPSDIAPDSETSISVLITPKLQAGDYLLEFDLVEEGVTWFGAQGSPTALVKIHVK